MSTPPTAHRIEVNFPLEDMRQFEQLIRGLKTENRFHLLPATERFVANLVKYAQAAKTVQLEAGTSFWRARLHDVMATEPLALEQMGAPPAHLAAHGRLNPRGIPYLYLASNELTAISEVRPWKHAALTVAEFRTGRQLKMANFSAQPRFVQPALPEMEGAEFTWRELIAWLFSAPFDPRDDTAYIPTQYLAERAKASEFDGLIYDSALHEDGYNIALFDPTAAVAVQRKGAKVTSINVQANLSALAAG
jgi:hypothetical protein